jgi:hypothetical protein
MRRLRSILLFVALLVVAGACARGVNLDSDPGETYAVNVENRMPHSMIVYFDDGSGRRLLGTVGANRTERFVVAGSRTPSVTIIAHDEGETHTVQRTATLVPGGTTQVVIQ